VASLVVNTFPQTFLEVLHHSLRVGRNCSHFFPDVLFQIHRCLWFLFVHLALEISSEEEVLRLGTLVPVNIEVPMKYPLSQDRIVVFEILLHSKSPMLYRPALHGIWNALSLATRALKDKFLTPNVPLTTVLQNRQVFLPDPVCCVYLSSIHKVVLCGVYIWLAYIIVHYLVRIYEGKIVLKCYSSNQIKYLKIQSILGTQSLRNFECVSTYQRGSFLNIISGISNKTNTAVLRL
jgi:hypothetical protein